MKLRVVLSPCWSCPFRQPTQRSDALSIRECLFVQYAHHDPIPAVYRLGPFVRSFNQSRIQQLSRPHQFSPTQSTVAGAIPDTYLDLFVHLLITTIALPFLTMTPLSTTCRLF
jgi:hypothetical protein